MRLSVLVFGSAALASCSAPKFTSSVKPETKSAEQENILVVSHYRACNTPVVAASDELPQLSVVAAQEAPSAPVTAKTTASSVPFSKRKVAKSPKVVHHFDAPHPAGLDEDLKWSIILTAAGLTGIVLMVVSSIFGILGGLMLIAGVVLFSRWILSQ